MLEDLRRTNRRARREEFLNRRSGKDRRDDGEPTRRRAVPEDGDVEDDDVMLDDEPDPDDRDDREPPEPDEIEGPYIDE